MLDYKCQHLQKLPSCFRMRVLFTCRLQLVATVGFSQAKCWGKAALCYRDEAASVLLVGQAGWFYYPETCLLDKKSHRSCTRKKKELMVLIYTRDAGTPSAGVFDVFALLKVMALL